MGLRLFPPERLAGAPLPAKSRAPLHLPHLPRRPQSGISSERLDPAARWRASAAQATRCIRTVRESCERDASLGIRSAASVMKGSAYRYRQPAVARAMKERRSRGRSRFLERRFSNGSDATRGLSCGSAPAGSRSSLSDDIPDCGRRGRCGRCSGARDFAGKRRAS